MLSGLRRFRGFDGTVLLAGFLACPGLGMPGLRPAQVAPAVGVSDYCNTWGCWTVYDDFSADFYTTSIYLGYAGKTIARVSFYSNGS